MAAVAATTDRRFRRAHVKPARRRSVFARRAWMSARVLAALVLVSVGAWRAYTAVANAPALQVSHILVHGARRLSNGEALALVDGLRGHNILGVNLQPWRDALLASPWVESAAIRRVLPSTVEITVSERVPMGIGRVGGALYLVDESGVLIDEYGPAYGDIDLPIIDGLAPGAKGRPATVDPARADLAVRVIAALATRPALAARVSQIDVANLRDVVVLLDDDTALLRLGDRDFADRLQQYLDLGPGLRERVPGIDSVDLRFDERVYVRRAVASPVAARQ